MSGNIIGQALTIASVPILSRLYTPSDFGTFSLVFTTISLFGYVACLGYDYSIMLPDTEHKALNLLRISLFLLVCTSAIVFIVSFVVPDKIYTQLGQSGLIKYGWLIAPGVLLVGLSQTFTTWYNRHKNYKLLARNKIIQNSSVVSVNLAAGIINPGTWGLILGYFSGQIVNVWLLVRKFKISDLRFSLPELKTSAREYKNFPLYLAPMLFLNTFSINILVYFVSAYYGKDMVGHYSQAFKVIGYPLFIISSSFSMVYYQKLNASKDKKRIYLHSALISLVLGVVILLPVMIWGESLFSFFIGKQWLVAGKMAAIIAPLTIASFVSSNVSQVYSVTRSNHWLLLWQAAYLIVAFIVIKQFSSSGIFQMLRYFVISGVAMYILLNLLGYFILDKFENNKNSLDVISK